MSPTRHCISDQQYETRTVEQILATVTGQGVQNESDWRRVLSLILQKRNKRKFDRVTNQSDSELVVTVAGISTEHCA